MIGKAMIAGATLCAMTLGGAALAQSVTSAPPPSENLVRLQERVAELEEALRQATSENERLAIELRRARAENGRLQKALDEAGQPAPGAAPPVAAAAPLPAAPAQFGDGMRLLQQGRFADAEAVFAAVARANPAAPEAVESRYFMGRTQLAQRRFSDAADTFLQFVTDYPTAPRAPEAWVMLGVSLRGMDKVDQACAVFRDLPVKYPRAGAGPRQAAANEARAANCR
jgi:tol-pal system protein YbgF